MSRLTQFAYIEAECLIFSRKFSQNSSEMHTIKEEKSINSKCKPKNTRIDVYSFIPLIAENELHHRDLPPSNQIAIIRLVSDHLATIITRI